MKKYKNNKLLQKILKMTYDSVAFTYGVSLAQVNKFYSNKRFETNLEDSLVVLDDDLSTRKITGHAALQTCANLIENLDTEDAELIKKIINRDLRINVGRTGINKIWPGLITKPIYMRCGIFSLDKEINGKIKKGTAQKIKFPAYLQIKADGTYRECIVENGKIQFHSRSGESYEYPLLSGELSVVQDGVYTGELTVLGISDRSEGNGLINSDNPPHEDIIFEVWDYITLEEYSKAGLKDKKNPCKITYKDRWNTLNETIKKIDANRVRIIPCVVVNSLQEASTQTSNWMKRGYEGAIIKDKSGLFKDGTSSEQLKIKVAFNIDVRVTGFIEGTIGTKREKTFGSVTYSTDDGMIRGSVSGFTDKELEDFNSRRDELVGSIFEIEANDITQARGSETFALSHPRFIEFRTDKTETDNLERAQESLEMAKLFTL